MTGRRFKCLTCRAMVSDKYIHSRRTEHKQFIQIGIEGEEEELSPTTKWSQELLTDELAGLKTMKIKISTHKAITEISTMKEGAAYDDVILMCINSYHREKDNKEYDPLSAIVTNDSEETED